MGWRTLIVFVLGAMILAAPATAHAPRLHSAKLVTFQPPIPAPDFTLADPDGRPIRLSDFRGRIGRARERLFLCQDAEQTNLL